MFAHSERIQRLYLVFFLGESKNDLLQVHALSILSFLSYAPSPPPSLWDLTLKNEDVHRSLACFFEHG